MKAKYLLILFFVLLSVNVTAGSMPYFIDEDTDQGYLRINDDLTADTTNIYYLEKTAGYNPNGSAVYPKVYDDFNDGNYDGWTVANGGASVINGVVETTIGGYLTYPYTLQSNEIMHVRIKQDTNGNSADYACAGVFPSYNNLENYHKAWPSDNDKYGIQEYYLNSWGSEYYKSSPDDIAPYVWYDFEVARVNNELLIRKGNESFQSVHTYSPYHEYSNIGFMTSGESGSYDYAYVRQYTANPPAVVVTDEGSYYKVQVTSTSDLSDYEISIPCFELDILDGQESILIEKQAFAKINLVNPTNNSCSNDNSFVFNVDAVGTLQASIFIDDFEAWNGSVTNGENQINVSLTEGLHTWYVNGSATYLNNTIYNNSEIWTVTYDSIDPSAFIVDVNPDYQNIAEGTTVQTNIKWLDTNLNFAEFYINNGSGYYLADSFNFTGSEQWFISSIDTTGLLNHNITWKQTAYDKAGNNYTYSNNFTVIQSELTVYVYDEGTGSQILPSSIIIYNDAISKESSISETTKTGSLSYGGLSSGKYLVSVDAAGYYSRRGILYVDVESQTELDIYLPATSETVTFDKIILTDNTLTYNESDCIIRLDKPLPNGTDTVFSSYFDFDGVTSTYLITSDQYILYIITPDKTISFGWLTPDLDGEIKINLQEITYSNYYDDWLDYTFNSDNESKTISLDYESKYNVNDAVFTIKSSGAEIYNSSMLTNTGTFNYVTGEDGDFIATITIDTDEETFNRDFIVTFGNPDTIQFFPSAYPEWVKSLIVLGVIIVFALAISAYRADLAAVSSAMIYGVATYNSWVYGNALTVSVIGIIAVASIVKFQRKQNRGVV